MKDFLKMSGYVGKKSANMLLCQVVKDFPLLLKETAAGCHSPEADYGSDGIAIAEKA